MGIFPKVRGKHKKKLKPPPSSYPLQTSNTTNWIGIKQMARKVAPVEPSKSPVGFQALGDLASQRYLWQAVDISSENHIYTVTFLFGFFCCSCGSGFFFGGEGILFIRIVNHRSFQDQSSMTADMNHHYTTLPQRTMPAETKCSQNNTHQLAFLYSSTNTIVYFRSTPHPVTATSEGFF